MAGGNRYGCPACDFVGGLGQLSTHLHQTPEHWSVRCQTCGVSILSITALARHEAETGHETALTMHDIVNVQKTTKISQNVLDSDSKQTEPLTKRSRVKSATKKRLMELGISEENSHQLARGRNMTDIKKLDVLEIATLLEVSEDDAQTIISKLPVHGASKSGTPASAEVKWREDILLKVMKAHNIDETQRDDFLRHAVHFDIPKNNYLKKSKLVSAALAWNGNENSDEHEIQNGDEPDNFEDSNSETVDSTQNSNVFHLKGMTISNFKGFKSHSERFIPLRPLTLVFGPNNGGKSSVLKSFSSLPQTIAKRKLLEGDYDWSPNGIWFDLGAQPHVLNNPDQPSFNIGYVCEIKNGPVKSTSPYHSVEFEYNIEDNIGVLAGISYARGKFEDDLAKILQIKIEKSPTVADRKIGVITYQSKELETKTREVEIKRKTLLKKMSHLQTLLEGTEDVRFLNKNETYHCNMCKKLIPAGTFGQHNKKKHDSKAKRSKLGGVFTKKQTKVLRRFMNEDIENLSTLHQRTIIYQESLEILLRKIGQIGEYKIRLEEISEDHENIETLLDFIAETKREWQRDQMVGIAHVTKAQRSLTSLVSASEVYRIETDSPPIGYEIKQVANIMAHLKSVFAGVDYLGATRLSPQRTYSSRTGQQTNQGVAGQRTLALLAENPELQEWVNQGLSELIGLEVKVDRRHTSVSLESGEIREYPLDELDVRISRAGSQEDRLQLPDVGYGVSQLLPILTGIRSEGMLVVEEPESNLHPAAQQQLMSKIIQQISENHAAAVLMETHSEHFLLEVLRALSDPECPLQDDDVAILYAYNTPEEGTVVKRHKTTNGTLDQRFPKEFTGDYGLSLI